MPRLPFAKVPFLDALHRAMHAAGVEPTAVEVCAYTCQRDWSDDVGYRVSSQSPDVQARAARWIETWIRKNVPNADTHVSTMLDGAAHVRERCYLIGD